MSSITVTEARKRLFSLVDSVAESHDPVHVSGKRHSVVLIGEDDWKALNETIYLHSIPGMVESILEGMRTPISKCSKELKW